MATLEILDNQDDQYQDAIYFGDINSSRNIEIYSVNDITGEEAHVSIDKKDAILIIDHLKQQFGL